MNRVVSAIMGEEMSMAIFHIPRPVARQMESTGMILLMNRVLAPFMAKSFRKYHAPGITDALFSETEKKLQQDNIMTLPEHLQGTQNAGSNELKPWHLWEPLPKSCIEPILPVAYPTNWWNYWRTSKRLNDLPC